MTKTKTLKVSPLTHRLIKRAAKKRGMTMKDYVEAVMTLWATDELEEMPRELDSVTMANLDVQEAI